MSIAWRYDLAWPSSLRRKWTWRIGVPLVCLSVALVALNFSSEAPSAGAAGLAPRAPGYLIYSPGSGRILVVDKKTGEVAWVGAGLEKYSSATDQYVFRWHNVGFQFRYSIQAADPTVNICLDSHPAVYGHVCGTSAKTAAKNDFQVWQERLAYCPDFGSYSSLQNTATGAYVYDGAESFFKGCNTKTVIMKK